MDSQRSPYSHLTHPGRIGSLWLPHRMLMGSMHLGIEGDAQMLDRLIAFYAERVRGGAALIITGGVAVHESGWEPHRFLISNPRHRQELTKLADAIHQLGGLIAIQLFHAGRYARSEEIGQAPWAPSVVTSRLSREVPQAMHSDHIAMLIDAYREAGQFSAQAGFDGVEIMASEGYLLNSFLSLVTNLRSDRYGGIPGGLRLMGEIACAVRDGMGAPLPLIFRISGWDLMGSAPDGSMLSQLTATLAKEGVDAFNVGIGWHESSVPTVSQIVPQGAFAAIGQSVRSHTDVPVMAANRIFSHPLADTLIANGMIDFVTPARPWLADPDWAQRAFDGDAVNPCIACNQACLDRSLSHPPQAISCAVNPRVLQESSYPTRLSTSSMKIAIVGAGPSGLAAARTAAELGHHVILYESSEDIGGQLRLAMQVPGKEEIAGLLSYYRQTLKRLGVQIILRATPDLTHLSAEVDAIIVATGVRPKVPSDISGARLSHVLLYPTAFADPRRVKGHVVIIGGGGIGLDLALFLAVPRGLDLPATPTFWDYLPHRISLNSQLRSITVVTRAKAGRAIGRSSRWITRQALQRLGVVVEENAEAESITTTGVAINQNGVVKWLPADTVILAVGQVSNRPASASDLSLSAWPVIGGARDARDIDIVRAIAEGMEVAHVLSNQNAYQVSSRTT